MKKTIFLLLFILTLHPMSVDAQLYQWTDDAGVVHITNDPGNVPEKYWKQKRVKKKPEPPAIEPVQAVEPIAPKEEKKELYGDYPIDWWTDRFKELRRDIGDNEGRLEQAKNFINVYERGSRYGKIYTKEEISQYEGYKADVPNLQEKVSKLKEELGELQRKATVYGVPRNIRE